LNIYLGTLIKGKINWVRKQEETLSKQTMLKPAVICSCGTWSMNGKDKVILNVYERKTEKWEWFSK